MDNNYSSAYDQLYKRLAAQVNFYPEARGAKGEDAERLKQIIEESEGSQDVRLRSDARYLLSVLLLQMVIMPVAIARPSRMDEVWDAVETDVATLVRRASGGNSEPTVSGHALLRTIDQSWPTLRTTSFRLWGD